MKKSDIKTMPDYYDRYIKLAKDIELPMAFDESIEQLKSIDKNIINSLGGKTYAEGKWSVKDILQHLIDTERVFNYRALFFARENGNSTPGFEQDDYAKVAKADKRKAEDILNELAAVRLSTKYLFDSFDNETLLKKGRCWDYEVSILAIGFIIIGHQIHHLNVIEEKYLPLIQIVK